MIEHGRKIISQKEQLKSMLDKISRLRKQSLYYSQFQIKRKQSSLHMHRERVMVKMMRYKQVIKE